MASKKVIVIGAGIAGLAAAFRLRQAGASVTVLESSARVGGRISTDYQDGYTIERGAQLITSTYRNTLGLLKELGLESALKPVSPWMAIVKDGKPRRLPSGAMFPLYALTSGLVGPADLLRFIWHTAKLRWPPVDNYSAWAEYDDMTKAQWATPRLGRATTYPVEPLVAGGLLQVMEETSRAVTLATLALTDNGRSKEMTLAGGMASLPETLASRLDVKLEAPVQAIETAADGVAVKLSGERLRADNVILATTAPVASRLYRSTDENEQKLLATGYTSTVRIGLATSRHWRDEPELKNVAMFLIPRPDRKLVVSATLESTKDIDRVPQGELLNLFVSCEAAATMIDLPEQKLIDAVLPDVERFFRGATASQRFAQVVKWREALPKSPVGRSRSLAEYRRSRIAARRLLLAGDYMGMPTFESAIETGMWAASAILGS